MSGASRETGAAASPLYPTSGERLSSLQCHPKGCYRCRKDQSGFVPALSCSLLLLALALVCPLSTIVALPPSSEWGS